MLLLGQQRTKVLYNTHVSQLKLLGILYDRVNEAFIQFMQFIKFQSDSYSHYAILLPKNCFQKLILENK